MLIVPAEHRFDLRHLPFGTLLLCVTCVLVYWLYQGDDPARVESVLGIYESAGLVQYEQALRESYAQAENLAVTGPELALHPAFDAYVREYWAATEPATAWREARYLFETARERISALRFGLVPSDVRPAALLGHMFLHGGIMHLVGNMIFLLLFGMLLERVIGTALFLGTYFVTGLLAAGLFIAFHSASPVPLVGASGAISGLMGSYLGVYGLRKVRFFYTVGFWFGEFTAPALLVFPLWLAKELHGHFAGDGPVAYMAHAGGLVGGLLLALLLKRPAAHVLEGDDDSRRRASERDAKLVRARQLMTDLRIADAVHLLEASIRQDPAEAAYWNAYAEAAARLPVNAEYHRVMSALFANATRKEIGVAFLRGQLAAYQERAASDPRALKGAGGAGLARRFYREGLRRDLDALLDARFRDGGFQPEFRELLDTLLQFAERNNDARRAERYRKYIAASQALADPS